MRIRGSYIGTEEMGKIEAVGAAFWGQLALDFHPGCVSSGTEQGREGPRVWAEPQSTEV